MSDKPSGVAFPSRTHVYASLVGLVAGMLIAGLLVPLVFASRATDSVDTGAGASPADTAGRGTANGGSDLADGGVASGVTSPAASPGASSTTLQPAASSGQRATTPLGTTDRGVTSTEVRVGILILGFGGAANLGFAVGIDPAQERAAWQAYFDEVNSQGGVAGRKLVPVFEEYDVTNADSQLAACRALTQDDKVFAVLGQFTNPAATFCVTRDNRTPAVSAAANTLDALYAQSDGRFISLFPKASRMMANFAADLDRRGALKGATLGIVTDETDDPGAATAAALTASLKQLGHAPTRTVDLSADQGVAASQIPVAVSQMQAAGVDSVLLLTGSVDSTGFVQTAQGQSYRPHYYLSDFSSNANDAANQNMPASFDGALVTTTTWFYDDRAKQAPPPRRVQCKEIYERRSGQRLTDPDSNTSFLTLRSCDSLTVFAAAARAAGANLTRATLTAALPAIGNTPLGTFGGGSFGRGKLDFADLIRTLRWTSSCKCLVPIEDFRAPAYR